MCAASCFWQSDPNATEIAVSIYILVGQIPPLPVPPLTEEVSDDTPPVDLLEDSAPPELAPVVPAGFGEDSGAGAGAPELLT